MTGDAPSQNTETRLWSEIDHARFGMLGLTGPSPAGQFQPMTAVCESDTREIWFFSRTDSQLAREIGEGADAVFLVQAKDQDFQAAVTGRIIVRHDQAYIDRHWNPMVAAWFPDGKHDPKLTLLHLSATRANVWITQGGPLKLAWEVGKAIANHTTPDLGDRETVDLTAHGAA